MRQPRIFALNAHATYACRHSHACCTAGWSIPVVPEKVALLGGEWLLPADDGACPKLDRQDGRCRVHRDHGELALPDSCRHFPRRSLIDDRGTFVSLSHFCPTAARMLLEHDAPLAIVEQPAGFPESRDYEGLDARGEWPPLLRPGVLFDSESFDLWERYLVSACGSGDADLDAILALTANAAEALRAWTVDDGPLALWTARMLQIYSTAQARAAATENGNSCLRRYASFIGRQAYGFVSDTIPAGLDRPALPGDLDGVDADFVQPGWRSHAGFFGRFLAAKAFASWTAYQSRGVRTQVAELVATLSVLRVECARACATSRRILDRDTAFEAVRMTDLLLVHLADRPTLMPWLDRAEE